MDRHTVGWCPSTCRPVEAVGLLTVVINESNVEVTVRKATAGRLCLGNIVCIQMTAI